MHYGLQPRVAKEQAARREKGDVIVGSASCQAGVVEHPSVSQQPEKQLLQEKI